MKLEEIRSIARQHQIRTAKLNKAELIRSIQGAEGNPACFNTHSSASCGQSACLWRGDCD